MEENYISFLHITKRFPGQKALDDVSFGVRKGEVHALCGENGAGKSTLLNILHGMFPASEGTVSIDGQEVRFANAYDAIRYGIAKVHQEINVIPELTVAQNILLGCEITNGPLLDRAKMERETQKLLDRLGCNFAASDKMRFLSTGKKQMVQIAKALYLNAKVISFDEPTSSLSNTEVRTLFKIIEDLRAQGITVLYISHKMDEIFEICDRATVLRDGKYVTTLDLAGATEEDLVQSMVGRDVSMFAQRVKPSPANRSRVVLEAEGLTGEKGFRDISFSLHQGEILGFFGLVGAMRTETMRGIFGADRLTGGTVRHNGKPVSCASPFAAVREGIGLIPENRKEEGFVSNLTNGDNIALACLKRFQGRMFVNPKKKYDNAKRIGGRVGLVPNDPEFMTAFLSGGNAQKVILAKWLSTDVDVLILDEPTKGIDIGAKAEIYKLMEEMLEEGKSIILISSELTEVMGMSDRIIVMREGRIAGELDRPEFAEERIIALAVGGSQQ